MARRKKPSVHTKCVANYYAAPNERIIEFAGADETQGGLIAFRITEDGKMRIDIYRQGESVVVHVGKPEKS